MKTFKNYRILITVSILILAFAIFLWKPIYTVIVNQETWSRVEVADYKSLFKIDSTKDLILFNTIFSETREPESQYIYRNDFNIFITKIHIYDTLDLGKDLTIKIKKSTINNSDLSFSIRSYGAKIHVKSEKLPVVNSIEIDVSNPDFEKINTVLNQTSYFFTFKTFSLILNKNQSYITAESEGDNFAAAVSFINRGNLLYVLVMTPANGRVKLRSDQLSNLLNK